MKLYAGFDLHGNNNYLGIIDKQGKKVFKKRLWFSNFMMAHTALAHKLARAAYFVMRDQVPFDPAKVFA